MPAANDLVLAPGTHLIHIGPQKTGSTALQNALHARRDELPSHGVYYASLGQVRAREAGWYVMGGAAIGRPAPRAAAWEELCQEVAGADPRLRLCVSNEDFGRADEHQAERILAGLGGEHPHVVSVVRRLDRYLPSQWQERVKARDTRSYDAWLRVVLAEESTDPLWRHVWSAHDVGRLTARWASLVGAENVTLVVADDADRSALPAAFEALLGLPAGLLRTDDRTGNRSLTLQEIELLRQLNERFLARGWPGTAYKELVQGAVVAGLRQTVTAGPSASVGFPQWAVPRVRALCDRQADAVTSAGVRVIGDPETLRAPTELTSGTWSADTVDIETAAAMAEHVIDRALRLEARARSRRRKETRGRPAPPELAAASTRDLAAALGARVVRGVRGRLRG